MTLHEKKRFAEQFMKRRTSRVVSAQSGYNDQLANFADPYKHDTLAGVNTDSGAPDTTIRTASVGDNNRNGTVPREGGDSDPAWKGDLTTAITHIQRAIENGGRGLDINTVAGLNLLASTAQKLVELPEGVAVPKAVASPEGSTRDPLVVADNDSSSHAGSHGFIPTSELQKMEAEAAKLTTLSARIVLGSGDKL